MWRKYLQESAGAQNCAERQRQGGPAARFPARGKDQEPPESYGRAEKDSEDEGFDGPLQAEPRAEQGHELGVAEAHALLTPDDPVEKPDEQDDCGSGEDGQERSPSEMNDCREFAKLLVGPVANEGEDEADGCAGQCEDVGEPQIFEVEDGERGKQPAKNGKTDRGDECCEGVVCRRLDQGWRKGPPTGSPEQPDGEFDGGVAEADGGVALAAASAKYEPTQEGQVFPPGEGVVAVAAVGARGGEALFLGKADQEDVEEAAAGEPEEEGEHGGGNPDCVGAGDGLLHGTIGVFGRKRGPQKRDAASFRRHWQVTV